MEINIDLGRVARDLRLTIESVRNTVELLDEGNTVPFVTRYRKDQTGGLDEEQIRSIQDRVAQLRQLAERKQTVLKSIESQDKLTAELADRIRGAQTIKRLEDIYLPYRPKKQTLATAARQRGLEPLADKIEQNDESTADLQAAANEFLNPEKGVASADDALHGVGHIVAERISERIDVRSALREILRRTGVVVVSKAPSTKPDKELEKAPAPAAASLDSTDSEAAATKEATIAPTATEPTATEPTATEPTATEPTATEPTATEPTATEPTATEPTATEPTATEPTATEPTATEPTATEPTATEPTATEPTATEPTATEPTATEPTATEPTAAEPTATEPTATDAATRASDDPSSATPPTEAAPQATATTAPTDAAKAAGPKVAPKVAKNVKSGSAKRTKTESKRQKKRQQLENAFKDYFDYRESFSKAPPHRVLAINRGERAKVLRVRVEVDLEQMIGKATELVLADDHRQAEFVRNCVRDAVTRLVVPSLTREVRREQTDQAEQHAVQVFVRNLRKLLLQPPVRNRRVLALDPGFRNGCKIAVVDAFGKVLATTVILIVGKKTQSGKRKLAGLIKKHNVSLIAIGNGAGCREAEQIVSQLLNSELKESDVAYVVVNEAGASVYSTSPLGREELPKYDAMQRSAISIGRRLLDPLSELVKINPANIGVGMYQHDIKAKHLRNSLEAVVESCVNYVGVDVNTASPALLCSVSGLNQLTARRLYEYRLEHGPFKNREQFKNVPGFGEATFVQAAGFLKIIDGDNPFDATWIHPESYDTARHVLERLGGSIEELSQSIAHAKPSAPVEPPPSSTAVPSAVTEAKPATTETEASQANSAAAPQETSGVAAGAAETTTPEASTPETTAPETTAPETTAPETTAPETTAPETTAPETTAPEITAPETTAPETTAPETTAPETTAPETTAPETTAPETTAPETTAPETTAPETTAPETTAPETTAPETTAPETTAPETTAPETTAPETTAPETTAPETTAPESAAPESTAPESTAPESTAPESTAPETTAPETTPSDSTAAEIAAGEPTAPAQVETPQVAAAEPVKQQPPALLSRLQNVDEEQLSTELQIGGLLLKDILTTLARPMRDPREDFPPPMFRRGIMKLEDLEAGMELEAVVLNVVDFGAFVDIGLSDSGLIHISRLADRYVKDPHEVVSVGDRLPVWVVEVDGKRRRVSLTAIRPGSEKPARARGEERQKHKKQDGGEGQSGGQGKQAGRPPRRDAGGTRRKFAKKTIRKDRKPQPPKKAKPITKAMEEGKEPMRSFSDLIQFYDKKPNSPDDKKKS